VHIFIIFLLGELLFCSSVCFDGDGTREAKKKQRILWRAWRPPSTKKPRKLMMMAMRRAVREEKPMWVSITDFSVEQKPVEARIVCVAKKNFKAR
jgi:hypothetical protein